MSIQKIALMVIFLIIYYVNVYFDCFTVV